jgi:hypothetical protein
MKALIDDNLSPIKSNPDDGDFRLKVQPMPYNGNTDIKNVMKWELMNESISDTYEFPTPMKNASPSPSKTPNSKYS